ncbi:MAG: MEDS domain-containing protein [Mycobacteriales bacterium]
MLTSPVPRGIDDPLIQTGRHVVQFYEHDKGLVDAASSYLGAGLVAGETVVVVATQEHRDAFDASMTAAGVEVGALRTSGQYLTVDAQALLDAFLTDGMPDPELFHANVGALVTRLVAARRQPLRIYGEMVALLWERGAVAEALALEELWNELGRRVEFTLYCAYPAVAMSDKPGDQQAVCAHHADVIPDPIVELTLPNEISQRFEPTRYAGPVARRFAIEALQHWNLHHLIDVTEMVLAEFVSNAIRHGSRRFRVTLVRHDDAIRLAVWDPSLEPPRLIEDDITFATSGRGIRMVDAVSTNWGVDVRADGKTVWADIAADQVLFG